MFSKPKKRNNTPFRYITAILGTAAVHALLIPLLAHILRSGETVLPADIQADQPQIVKISFAPPPAPPEPDSLQPLPESKPETATAPSPEPAPRPEKPPQEAQAAEKAPEAVPPAPAESPQEPSVIYPRSRMQHNLAESRDYRPRSSLVSTYKPAKITPAQPEEPIAPAYPQIARIKGIEGTVTVRARIDAAGNVLSVSVDSSSGSPLLDDAALESVRETVFLPARRGYRQISWEVLIPITFTLEQQQ